MVQICLASAFWKLSHMFHHFASYLLICLFVPIHVILNNHILPDKLALPHWNHTTRLVQLAITIIRLFIKLQGDCPIPCNNSYFVSDVTLLFALYNYLVTHIFLFYILSLVPYLNYFQCYKQGNDKKCHIMMKHCFWIPYWTLQLNLYLYYWCLVVLKKSLTCHLLKLTSLLTIEYYLLLILHALTDLLWSYLY
jgi:hypothetical protein